MIPPLLSSVQLNYQYTSGHEMVYMVVWLVDISIFFRSWHEI